MIDYNKEDVRCVSVISSGALTHTLRWDEMGWAALVTQCVSMEAFTHWPSHPILSHSIPTQRVCECTITLLSILLLTFNTFYLLEKGVCNVSNR